MGGGSLASPQKPSGGREPVRRGRLVLTGDCGEVLWVINCVCALTVVRDLLSDIVRLSVHFSEFNDSVRTPRTLTSVIIHRRV